MISEKVINEIKSAKKYEYIIKVGIFGSCARDEETSDSDIDILIDYNGGSDEFLDELDDFMEKIENCADEKKVDFVTLNGLMKSKNEKIKNSILNEVVWLYIKP